MPPNKRRRGATTASVAAKKKASGTAAKKKTNKKSDVSISSSSSDSSVCIAEKVAAIRARKARLKKGDDDDDSSSSNSSASNSSEQSSSDDEEPQGKAKAPAASDVDWAKHPAREILKEAFLDGTLPLDYSQTMGPKKVWEKYKDNPAFKDLQYNDTFTRRLRDLREQCRLRFDRADIDKKAYDLFLKNHPRPTHNHRGEPRWEGSAAQAYLKRDMKKGRHKKHKTPKKFWQSRPEYQLFTNEKFRKHIDQEKRLWKMERLLRDKAKQELRAKGMLIESDEDSNSGLSCLGGSDVLSSSSDDNA